MATFMEHLGGLVDRWRGRNYTRRYNDQSTGGTHSLDSKVLENGFYITVVSRRIVYLTTYRRWWVPNRRRTVYEVVCTATPEVRRKMDPVFFVPVVYPLLCTRLLEWSPYPHIYAIHAFLGQIPHRTEIPSFSVVA